MIRADGPLALHDGASLRFGGIIHFRVLSPITIGGDPKVLGRQNERITQLTKPGFCQLNATEYTCTGSGKQSIETI